MIHPARFTDKWPTRSLGDVVDFLDNLRRPVKEEEREPGAYPYYGANGQQGTINNYIFDEPLVLLAEDGGFFGMEGKTIAYKVEGKCWVNNHAHVLRLKDFMDISFLCRQLETYDVTPFVSGTTRGKLTKGSAEQISVLVPPLDEQHRIAAILDKADAIRRKRQEAIRLTEKFLRSVFLDMFGDPVTNPKGWEIRCLKELGKVKTGGTPPSVKEGMFGGSIPFVTPGDLETDASIKRTVTEEGAAESVTVRAGATLVCCIGATIGKMSKATQVSAFNQQINAVEWRADVNDDFGLAVLRFFKPQIAGRGSSTTLPILKKSLFEKIEIPVPPYPLQRDFSRRVIAAGRVKISYGISATQQNLFFNSLVHHAFRGEL